MMNKQQQEQQQQSNPLPTSSSSLSLTSKIIALGCTGKDYDLLVEEIYGNIKANLRETHTGKR